MDIAEVKRQVERVIREIAEHNHMELPELKDQSELVDDLGFASLSVAALIANLEDALGVDPFQAEDVMITDIRTIGDLCAAYTDCLAKQVRQTRP
ncbi:MAG TPA: acyl carrier protein [Fibrobacteria bacterium]|nr:acyl carrier protein [Fibrobacteria bacterium]